MVAIATWDGKCLVWQIQHNEMQAQQNETLNDKSAVKPQFAAQVQQMSMTQVEGPILGMCWQAD